ncbi:unnamed protein product [Blepharisma stoltei]|uniref:Protein kinase domain-containing protein n=1 Tax=Blepharisma stoltei TaxID=1481888 RepID=A0AAU9JV15_9CILI|nr:unnamed protein product [Blepharisma stoltei]
MSGFKASTDCSPFSATNSALDSFTVLKRLEKGGTSIVKLVQNPSTKDLYAAKILKNSSRSYSQNLLLFEKEVNFLRKLSHSKIVKLLDYKTNGTYTKKNNKGQYFCTYILMEYCPNKDMLDFVMTQRALPESQARGYFCQIIEALEECSRSGICHGDLKLENVMLDEKYNAKLIDFGFSKDTSKGELAEFNGTDCYMAPEIRARKKYNGTKADVFSAGVALFIMYIGAPPFARASPNDSLYKLLLFNRERFWEVQQKNSPDKTITKEFRSLIEKLLSFNPGSRPDWSAIKDDEWCRQDL